MAELEDQSYVQDDLALKTLRFLASQVEARPLVYLLVCRDVERWSRMDGAQRQESLKRNIWRVGAVAPWTKDKGRLRAAMRSFKPNTGSAD